MKVGADRAAATPQRNRGADRAGQWNKSAAADV